MNRRRLLLLLGSALTTQGRPAWAQSGRTHRIAWLASASKPDTVAFFEAFQEGLRALGYHEGRNLVLDARWGDYSGERTERLAGEIAGLRPAVIVTQGGALRPASRLSPALPVVFIFSGDPVEAGFAASLARPGGNLTGVSLLALDLVGKRIETLKEILPNMGRVAIIANPQHPGEHRELAVSRAAAAQLRVEITYHPARSPAELDTALGALAAARPDAAVVFPDALTLGSREALATFFLQQRIPSATGWAPFAESGHLVSYGPDLRVAYRRLAYFADRIIKGATPADLPIELPTTFEMVVNRRTAAALKLVLPSSLLLRADRVVD